MLTPGQYTHHPRCPHLIAMLQRVVDEVCMPMWVPGPCSGTIPILVRGLGGPRVGAAAAPAPQVECTRPSMAMLCNLRNGARPEIPPPGRPVH